MLLGIMLFIFQCLCFWVAWWFFWQNWNTQWWGNQRHWSRAFI